MFAQEGITNQAGTINLLRKAMAMGGDDIGSALYVDPNPVENIRTIFDLAQAIGIDEYGIEVGKIADLVLIEAKSVSEIIGVAPVNRTTIERGAVVAQLK